MRVAPEFKRLTVMLGVTLPQAALLAGVSYSHARRYARHGAIDPEYKAACGRLQYFIARVRAVAAAFRHAPERIYTADLPPMLRDKVRQEIEILNIMEAHKRS